MTDYLEFSIDKFTFRIATDRNYTEEGLWVKQEENHLRVGLSDFLQQRSGDVAFVEIKPAGSLVSRGDELIVLETIKVNITLASPVTGKVLEVNPAMESTPEVINQDPYGKGWMLQIELLDLKTDLTQLLNPKTYFARIKQESESEVKKD
ncbi:MAG TPA: glycine cleavage system protein H [Anaerolineales bacterium]